MSPMPHKFAYSPFFCEENIWHLAARLRADGVAESSLTVLVLSNRRRQIPLLGQRAGRADDGLVLWDYHVILFQAIDDGLIFDFDTRLPFPCPFADYHARTFPRRLPAQLQIVARLVPAAAWQRHFSSDRRHMRDALGQPVQPFPPWPAICPPQQGIDLQVYLDMRNQLADSQVCGVEHLFAALAIQ